MTHILIVESRFYEDIADELLKGATQVLDKEENITHERLAVPGAFEIAPAIAFAHRSEKFHGYIALGCVIRGETSHYEYVCAENARGLGQLALDDGLAIGYGVVTVENKKQAMERASVDKVNRGGLAAKACLNMIKIKRRFSIR